MNAYEKDVYIDLSIWKKKMRRSPSLINRMSKGLQNKVNKIIPEKVHAVISNAIQHMTRLVLTGSRFTTPKPLLGADLKIRELEIKKKIKVYRNTATAEGAITGAGGLLLGLADFPLWLTVKMKMLFEIAALYGRNVNDFRERLYILYIFQLAFSSHANRKKTFELMEHWNDSDKIPASINEVDWRTFQQEYRDYIDLAKLFQLIPGIGAAVGAYVNHKHTERLGNFAMQAYRMRMESKKLKITDLPTLPVPT
jgi:uncharacterized protein (DUF697 family)